MNNLKAYVIISLKRWIYYYPENDMINLDRDTERHIINPKKLSNKEF